MRNRLLFSSGVVEEPEWIQMQCGPLSLFFVPESGALRSIRLGDHEVIRAIYVAVRDRNWNTITPQVENLTLETQENRIRIAFDVCCRNEKIDFYWHGTVHGEPDGSLRYTMEGEAQTTFLKNRIGICILHPIEECAGNPCVVETGEGVFNESHFPDTISPHQPFLNMRSIAHEVQPGVRAEVRFEGDIFEMEDQRNWTDASFKTYSTPIDLPYPVPIEAGTRLTQSVTLTLHGEVPQGKRYEEQTPVTLRFADLPPTRLPALGLGIASHGIPLTPVQQERLRALHISHLRVNISPGEPGYRAKLTQAIEEAEALGVSLEIALFLTNNLLMEMENLTDVLEKSRPPVARWLLFHPLEAVPTEQFLQRTRPYLERATPEAQIGSGTDGYFAELNRNRPSATRLDCVTFSLNPQVHAFDNATLRENLVAQSWAVANAKQFSSGKPVVVSPVTFRPRFNPNKTDPDIASPNALPASVDTRKLSLFGAGWTLGSIKYLAESGASSVTYYETTGWGGVMETEEGSPLPEQFSSQPNDVFPLYHVLADVGEWAQASEVCPLLSTDPLRVEALALKRNGSLRILLANLTDKPQNISFPLPQKPVTPPRLWQIDASNQEEAMQSPETFRDRAGVPVETENGVLKIALLPFAFSRIDMDIEEAL